MNTHDKIELPPLPNDLILQDKHIRRALENYAIAAIEADRKRTTKHLAAYETLVASLEAKCTHMRKMYDELKARTNPDLLASERAANAILTSELEADRKYRGEPVAWHPIETAPHGVEVLLGWLEWDSAWKTEVSPASWGRVTKAVSNIYAHGQATHWMPIPPAPQPAEQVIPSEITDDKLSAEQSAWHAGWEASRDALPRITDADIQRIMLNNGYTVKPGHDDLRPYIYAAARELIAFAQGRNL